MRSSVKDTMFVTDAQGSRHPMFAKELMSKIEVFRPVSDEIGEWDCAQTIYECTDMDKDEIGRMLGTVPVIAGRIYQLILDGEFSSVREYVRDWREGT